MLKFAANISHLFTELPYLDRFEAAASAGFRAVEMLDPYQVAAKETQRALLANGLDLVLINAPPPNYTGGVPGFAALPDGIDRFRNDIRRVLRYCEVVRPNLVHIMSGYTKDDGAFETLARNLQWAADQAPDQMFSIEPLNPGDQPGYFLDDFDLAAQVLDAVDRPNMVLQFDSYHAQVIHGDALAVWERHKSRVGHIQVGDAPHRTEPGSGDVDFDRLFSAITEYGYSGWVSAEYGPTTDRTELSLGWMP